MSKAAAVALKEFMEQEKYTDFFIICNGVDIPVHKNIACANSAVIDAACQNPWKDAGKSFTINEFACSIVKMMVEFFYTGHYDAATKVDQDAPDQQSELALHAQMFAMADRYVIPELQQLAISEYKQACFGEDDIFYFLQSARIAYTYTPNTETDLHKVIVVEMDTRRGDIAGSKEATEAFTILLNDLPELAKDLVLQDYATNTSGSYTVQRCGWCGRGRW